MPLPHAGMRASTRWLVCNSLSHCSESEPGMLLAQVNQSLLPAQLWAEKFGVYISIFFVHNQRNLLQILPSQNSAMTFFTSWRGSLRFWSLFPLPVTGHRGWLALASEDSSSSDGADVVAPGWCCNGRSGAPWTMQAWELCTATPYSRQTWRGKANWDYLTNCLTNQHLFLQGGKWERVNMPNSFETKWLLTFRQTFIIISLFPPGSNLPSPVSAKDNLHSCLERGCNL